MFTLEELEQFAAFAEIGTLSQAAEKLHISQPTITRTMQHLEECFKVPLFVRGKNRISLNETGRFAVEQARRVLDAADSALRQVQDYDRSLRTITVSSCAPAPLWYVLPALSSAFPRMTIASSLKDSASVWEDLSSDLCRIAVLPHESRDDRFLSFPFLRERLFICVPPSHALAGKTSVTFRDLNGFNFLLKSEIGFWDGMCRKKMPASHFLVQNDEFEFNELVRSSSLPCFATDLAGDPDGLLSGRVLVPLTDLEADVTYHLACRKENRDYLTPLRERLPHSQGSTGAGRKFR